MQRARIVTTVGARPTRGRDALARRSAFAASGPTRLLAGVVLAGVVLAGGCSPPLAGADELHESGRFERAAEVAATGIKLRTDHNLVWKLYNQGKILQDAGEWQASGAAFDRAISHVQNLGDVALFSATGAANNTTALLTDERNRDYFGTAYDKLMVRVSQTVNMVMLQRVDEAVTYARQQADLQDAAFAEKLKANPVVDQLEDRLKSRGGTTSAQSAIDQPGLNEIDRQLADRAAKAEGYEIAYGWYVAWLAHTANGDTAEAEQMRLRFRSARPESALATADTMAAIGDRVFVLFENGSAAERYSIKDAGTVPGAGLLALPGIRERPGSRATGLVVRGGGDSARAELITDVDAIVFRDFRDRRAEIWGRPILSAAIKTGIGLTVSEVVIDDDQDLAQNAVRLATVAWVLSAQPDLRTWRTLPAELWAAEIPRPTDGRLAVELQAGAATSQRIDVDLPPGSSVLFVRSTRSDNIRVFVAPLGTSPGQQKGA